MVRIGWEPEDFEDEKGSNRVTEVQTSVIFSEIYIYFIFYIS